MKTEEIKELFEQFESIANEYEGSNVGVRENFAGFSAIRSGKNSTM